MRLLYSLVFLFLSTAALAQPGGLDKTYGTDSGMGSGTGVDNSVFDAVKQSDNYIVATGYFTTAEGIATRVVRYKPDGTIDPAYKPVTMGGYNYRMGIQSDNKVIVVGEFTGGNIMRLNTDGTIDQTFATNIGTGAATATGTGSAMIDCIFIQPDDKILLGGLFTKFNNTNRTRIVRLNSDGTVDNTFTPGEGADAAVTAMAIQSTGKIIIAGTFKKYDGSDRNGLARLNSDGSLDASFNPNSFDADHGMIYKILVNADNELFIGGLFQKYASVSRYQLVKTDIDGNLDIDFNGPINFGGYVYDMEFAPTNKIIVGGAFSIPATGIVRIDADFGTYDNTFTLYDPPADVQSIIVQDDGKIFIAGGFNKVNGTSRAHIARLLSNGYLEGGRGADGTVYASLLLPGDLQLIAGDFTGFRGIARGRISQVSASGFMNDSFNPADGANGTIYAMARDADGKIIIAGNFTSYRGVARARIARINTNGTLDNTFDPGAGANAIIRSVAIQADGAILIGGDFTNYDGIDRGHIARIESDGDLDTSFVPGAGANGNVQNVIIQASGKIIAVGNFSNYAGISSKRIVRINANGSIDDQFTSGTGADAPIYVVKIDAAGRLVIGGSFSVYNGVTRKGIARLTADGALDDTFNASAVDYATVRTITIKASGNIFVGGDFTKRIALLLPTGETNADYYADAPPNNTVFTSVENADGLIIIGGQFTTYDSKNVDRLARVLNLGRRDQTITFAALGNEYVSDPEGTLAATSSSGLPVTYTADNDKVTIVGNKINFIHAGTVNITAAQAGNEKYSAAPSVSRTLTILKGNQEVVWDIPGNSFFQGKRGTEFPLEGKAHSTRGLTPITFSSSDGKATISEDGTKFIIQSPGLTFLYAEQTGNDDYNPSGRNELSISIDITSEDPDDENPVTGLEDEDHGIIAYPNPTEGELTIQLPLNHSGARATLTNTLGVPIDGGVHQAGQNLKLDLSPLPKGIYLIRVQSGDVHTVKRVHRK